MAKKIALSGVQPTGNLHIGNYLGAIKNWLKLQDQYNCIFFVANLHALTVKPEAKFLADKTRELVGLYLAAGLDPDRCTFFVQSEVPEHAELTWILNCVTKMGELERMTQYKEKAKKNKENINAGLFTYPVLMAADILLYRADIVPVGEDQTQHLEITRTIASRFDKWYGNILRVPEPVIQKKGARIMSLTDPKKKMSKTDPNTKSYIYLLDKPGIIRKKIMSAVTDSENKIKYNPAKKPAISNLLEIYSLFTDRDIKTLEREYTGKGYGEFKSDLAEVLVSFLEPLQTRYKEVTEDTKLIDHILRNGAIKARAIAAKTIQEVKKAVGVF